MVTVTRPSPASRAGLKKGDIILSCNGFPVTDWVDLLAQSSAGTVNLHIRRGLSEKHVKLRRGPGEELGIHLSDSEPRSCGNRCIFCFVDQQPPGLRPSLLVKDDDVRYSFLQGTYITLTNRQTAEAISRGFNTLHVSVHAADPELRGRLLGRPGPMPILSNIDMLAEHGIEVQAQIVVVPGYNDGKVLEDTIEKLLRRSNVRILGIVPVGLTGHRNGLTPLRRPSAEEAASTLDIIAAWQNESGSPRVFAADEYYLLAPRDIPGGDHYTTCTLQANGIGLMAAERDHCAGRNFTGEGLVATGELAYPFISTLLEDSGYTVLPVWNTLMGREVGVAGLLSGADVIHSTANHHNTRKMLFLPSIMFNHRGLTLDGISKDDISNATGMDVSVIERIGDLP